MHSENTFGRHVENCSRFKEINIRKKIILWFTRQMKEQSFICLDL